MSRNYLEAFAIILIAVGVGFFLVLPKYNDLQATKMKIAEKTRKSKIARNILRHLARRRSSFPSMRPIWKNRVRVPDLGRRAGTYEFHANGGNAIGVDC